MRHPICLPFPQLCKCPFALILIAEPAFRLLLRALKRECCKNVRLLGFGFAFFFSDGLEVAFGFYFVVGHSL